MPLFVMHIQDIGLLGSSLSSNFLASLGSKLFFHQFNDGEGSIVAHARSDLENPGVAPRTIGVTRSHHIKKPGDNRTILNDLQSLATGMKITTLAKSDHLVSDLAQFFGSGIGRCDPLVIEQRRHHVAQHGLTVTGIAAKPLSGFIMTHGSKVLSSLIRRPETESLGVFLALLNHFHVFRIRKILEFYPEAQAHFGQDIFNFIQRLATKILGFKHFGF